jgi:hypothetical protein
LARSAGGTYGRAKIRKKCPEDAADTMKGTTQNSGYIKWLWI